MATIPPGTVPIRNYLRSLGVPDNLIKWDPEDQVVRVGGQTIRPNVNLGGTTFATPQVLRQAMDAVNQFLLPPPAPAQSQTPLRGPQPVGVSLQNTLAGVSAAVPALQGLLSNLGNLPLSPEATESVGRLTGRLPGGAPTIDTQAGLAELFTTLGSTAGQFGQVPQDAGLFADLLGQFAGRQTEQRRSNLADEAIRSRQAAVAEGQLKLAQQEYAANEALRKAASLNDASRRFALQRIADQIIAGTITTPQQVLAEALRNDIPEDDVSGLASTLKPPQEMSDEELRTFAFEMASRDGLPWEDVTQKADDIVNYIRGITTEDLIRQEIEWLRSQGATDAEIIETLQGTVPDFNPADYGLSVESTQPAGASTAISGDWTDILFQAGRGFTDLMDRLSELLVGPGPGPRR